MDKDHKTNWMMRWIGGDLKNNKKNSLLQWIILFMLVGMGVMIAASFFDVSKQVIPDESQTPAQETVNMLEKDTVPKTMRDYEKLYENQLTEVLTEMIGVEQVLVKVNLESTEELMVEKNRSYNEQITKEKDNQGGSREIKDVKKEEQVVLYHLENNEEPLIIKKVKPKVRGVVVVAKGAENMQVKAMITEAVQRLLDVPPHKIAILPRKSE